MAGIPHGWDSVSLCHWDYNLEGIGYTSDISIKGFLRDMEKKRSTDDETKCSYSNLNLGWPF